MLRFLKKMLRGKDLFQNWSIPIGADYQRIDNNDSLQFINKDESRILYFSILTIKNNHLISTNTIANREPTITQSENGWDFKGVKERGNEVLVCVFSFTNESDETWIKNLFTRVTYIGE
ncbi:MAG: hypothetical protein JWQ38_601 [Flavipsychrobacter sp.]|nr:hypothetical protein [Flavipsychrobacter sp.]